MAGLLCRRQVWRQSGSIDTFAGPTFANPLFLLGSGSVSAGLASAASGPTYPGGRGDFAFGGQVGYNWQALPNIVLGAEADIAGVFGSSHIGSSGAFVQLPNFTERYSSLWSGSDKLDYLGTVRARLGAVPWQSFLFYVTGGLAYGQAKAAYSFTAQESLGPATYPAAFAANSYSGTRVGWTVGFGGEWMLLQNWSLKAEYLYYDLGKANFITPLNQMCPTACGPTAQLWGAAIANTQVRFRGQVIRAGANYHFNWGAPAPIVAKY